MYVCFLLAFYFKISWEVVLSVFTCFQFQGLCQCKMFFSFQNTLFFLRYVISRLVVIITYLPYLEKHVIFYFWILKCFCIGRYIIFKCPISSLFYLVLRHLICSLVLGNFCLFQAIDFVLRYVFWTCLKVPCLSSRYLTLGNLMSSWYVPSYLQISPLIFS